MSFPENEANPEKLSHSGILGTIGMLFHYILIPREVDKYEAHFSDKETRIVSLSYCPKSYDNQQEEEQEFQSKSL